MKTFTLFCAAVFTCSTMLTHAGNKPYVIIPGERFPTSFKMDPRVTEKDYLPNTIVLKVKQQYRQNCKVNSIDNLLRLQDLLNSVNVQDFKKIYPNHRAPQTEYNEIGLPMADLSLIYSFKYTSTLSIEKVINQLLSLGYFEFVEPKYIYHVDFTPNDTPGYSSQYHLKGNVAGSIDTQTAWDTQKGSASVVIGIVDTGTQPTHPDLAGNYLGGYDVAMNDNDPTWEGNNHGCAVSGDACAVTNNSAGVASPGFNCKFKAAKIADAGGTLIAGYEGITWAADNGCKIINCSWGGPGGGAYGQTVIDYAINNKNCLMCVSAGNGSVEEFLYPSSYIGVFRVASTTSTDAKSGFSSYGLDVDYGSPGTGIYSTINGTGYGSMDGTSMASPVSAGVAGLIQSQFNYSNATQIGERMKQTCDPYVGSSTLNLFNAGKLGKGRIDAGKAVNPSVAAKSIVMNPITITDGNDNVFMPSENLSIGGTFINYLDASSASAAAVLTVVSGPGTVTNGNYTIGALATLGTVTMTPTPFTVSIQANAAVNAVIKFKVTITDGSFTGAQYFEITVNPDYINIVNNDVHTSITSKGRIGYNQDATKQGLGFEYQIPTPNNMLYEMSLMVGTSSTKVSDMFREAATGNTDFGSVTRVYEVKPATVSDFDVDGKFSDAPAAGSAIPVTVHHSAYAWSTTPYRKFVIVKYVIKNTGASTLSNLYAGIVADWDITVAAQNKSKYDATNKMGYCYDNSTANGLYAGIKLLTNSAPAVNYCIDNVAGGNGGIDPATDFLTAEKYTALSTSRNADGFPATVGSGGDVMHCVSSGPFNVPANDSITVAFALIGGDNLVDLQNSACEAQHKWDNTGPCATGINDVTVDNLWMDAYPNPASNSVNFNYNITGTGNASLRIMNTLGEVVMVYNNLAPGKNTLSLDVSKLNAGNYFYELKAGGAVLTKKLNIVK